MPLIVFNILLFLIILIIKLAIFLGLLKLFNKKSKIITIIKGFFIYEAIIFVLCWFYYPATIFGGSILNGVGLIRPISFVIIACAVFLIIVKKLELLNWTKGVILFLLMFVIVGPVLGFYVNQIAFKTLGDSVITSGLTNITDVLNNPFHRTGTFSLTRIVSQLKESIANEGVMFNFAYFLSSD